MYWSFVHYGGGHCAKLFLHLGGGVSYNEGQIHGSWRLGREGEPDGIYATWHHDADGEKAREHYYSRLNADVKVWELITRDGSEMPNKFHKCRCLLLPALTQPTDVEAWTVFKEQHENVFDDTASANDRCDPIATQSSSMSSLASNT